MPRDGSGNYTLPAGVNPVVTGTVIDVAWANPTMDDVAVALTDSLSRSGSGGMLVPFLNADGAIGAPGISWVNETTMGIYRPSAGVMRTVITGVDRTRWLDDVNPFQVWIVSDASWRPMLNTFNPYNIVGDWTWEGRVVTDDSTTVRAGFNIPLGVAPTVPVEGDMWKEATNAFIYVNGVAESIIGAGAAIAPSTQASSTLRGDGAGGYVENTICEITAAGDILLQESQITMRGAAFDTAISFTDVAGANGLNIFASGTGSVETIALSGGGGWIWGTTVVFDGRTNWNEKASTTGPNAGQGEIWVRNDAPTSLMFTDDEDIDYVVAMTQVFNNIGDPRTVNNSTTPVTIPQLSGMVLEVGQYKIEIQLLVNQASITPDLLLRLNGSASFANEIFRVTSISQVTNAFTFQDAQAHTVLGAVQDQVGNHLYRATAIVEVNGAGTMDLQFAQQNATVANTIVDDPSYVIVTRLP